MGFTLRIINPPSGGTHWSAHFWSEEEGRFISPSPTPTINEIWDCPFNPYGAPEGLRILVLDFVNARTVLDVDNLGPIYDGKDYEFNCSTRVLSEVVVPEILPCEITITAPESAQEGEKVSVSALLRNVSSISIMYKIEIYAVPDLFPDFRIGTIEKYIDSGSTFTAYGSFTMPASNTTILIWVERWAVDHWVYDNSASRVISLKIPVPEFAGTISKKELEYDETRSIIPVY